MSQTRAQQADRVSLLTNVACSVPTFVTVSRTCVETTALPTRAATVDRDHEHSRLSHISTLLHERKIYGTYVEIFEQVFLFVRGSGFPSHST